MAHEALLKRITARPEVFGGKPIIRDMRISVELILSLQAQGETSEGILRHIWTRRRGQGAVELTHERGQMLAYIRPLMEGL